MATTHARKPKQAVATHQRHRSLATETAYIPGYPTKLYIYLHGASQYWWVRYYFNGRVRRKKRNNYQSSFVVNRCAIQPRWNPV